MWCERNFDDTRDSVGFGSFFLGWSIFGWSPEATIKTIIEYITRKFLQ